MASLFVLPVADVGSGIKPPDGAKLFFFETGTTTPKDTYTDSAATTPHANPVVADSNGVFPAIFITGTYKVRLTNKNDVQVGFGEEDPVDEFAKQSSILNDSVFRKEFTTDILTDTTSPAAYESDYYNSNKISGSGAKWVATGGNGTASTTDFASGFIYNANGDEYLISVDSINPAQFGALFDGSTDDSAALLSADSFMNTVSIGTNGTLLVSSNISLTSDYIFKNGGIIKADTGFTVTWTGSITAEDVKILEGDFSITKVHRLTEVRITWFGAQAGDLSTDVTNQALADANGKAIREANTMTQLGIPDGIYVTPVLKIPTGLFIVDDDNTSGDIINCGSYATILGEGWSSVIRPVDNAKELRVIRCNTDGANNIIIDNFQIYGESSTQTAVQHGIEFIPPTSAMIYCYIGDNLHIKEMSGAGITVGGAGLDNSTIEPRLVRDSKQYNLFVSACDRLTVQNGIYRTSKTGFSGALFDGTGCVSAIIRNNQFDENDLHGLHVSNVSGRFSLEDNRCQSNSTGSGIFIDRCDNAEIVGNYTEQNATSGIVCDQLDNCNIDGNTSRSNGQHGILISSTNNSSVSNNNSYGNSTSADDTFSGIQIASNSDDNNVQLNTVRHLGGATQQKYGIEINDAASANNVVTNNDLKNSGRTANLFDNGGGTVTTAGNRV